MNRFLLPIFLLIGLQSAFAQQSTISGTVTNPDGSPIEFVNVVLKEINSGAVTDQNGNYSITTFTPGRYTLISSFVGYQSAERKINIQENEHLKINFTLKDDALQMDEITVTYTQKNKFHRDSSFIVSKLPLKDIENPQVYNSIPKTILKEQVVTNMNDALKNATGVTRLWESTGRGGDGAEFYSMRGFSVQPTLVNGMPAINNAGLDPANVESIDIIKGPSGTLFGSPVISYGGLINITTKQPYESFGGSINYITGSNGLNRIATDVNTKISEQAFARVNMAYNKQNSFQDAGFSESFFIAPSFKFQPSEKLTFLLNTEFLQSESANNPMLFLNRGAELSYDNINVFQDAYSRSFNSNDLTIRNPSFGLQAQALYEISDNWTSQTVVSRSNTKAKGFYHYLWDLTDGESFARYISKRNSETNTTDIQQNFLGDFKIGGLRNRIVIGLDYFNSELTDNSSAYVQNGTINIQTQEDTGILTQAGTDALLEESYSGINSASNEVMSAYISNVINITPALSAMASVRLDRFGGKPSIYSGEEIEQQYAVSPKFGIVYQVLQDKLSVFGNYMNGFSNVAPQQVANADGSNPRLKTFDPENANQYEGGIKSNFFNNRVSATASYYHITVANRLMTDPENINNSIQGGEVVSKGYELSLTANPVNGLNLIAGYSNNESEVTKDYEASGYLGLRPEEAGPAELINFWASYSIPNGDFKGLGLGFGGNIASEYKTLNRAGTGTFTLPAYQIFNASLSYSTFQYDVILKVNNIMDEQYFSGWSTVTPQNLRNYSLSLNFKF
ncbi:TonB-dependent receptor [uncultured Marivirga sp.]|uniref:TonB-dependent receptor n=1 Tax=uncultured Marivirga sp. TaxID=1123707 RepID=UPI0030ECED8B|tara:strand:- start:13235 stop:15610 length:2376 start_codon:yes stop_codon:yes gene_type:complete